jgi:hypothetical protein
MYQSQSTSIEQIAERDRRPPFRSIAGVTTAQLVALLRLDRNSLYPNYRSAVVGDPTQGRATVYSRAGVAEQLSEFSGRPVGFPSKPLLRVREVIGLALAHGVKLNRHTVTWAVWRALNRDHPKAQGGLAPLLLPIRVTPDQVRIAWNSALEYIADYRAYLENKR